MRGKKIIRKITRRHEEVERETQEERQNEIKPGLSEWENHRLKRSHDMD